LPDVGPGVVLSLVVGTFHAGVYLLIRGWLGPVALVAWLAALLGAWAGQALAARIGDPLTVGDFGVVWSSLLAWVGIVIVNALGELSPARDRLR
jgi:hypothetical protein